MPSKVEAYIGIVVVLAVYGTLFLGLVHAAYADWKASKQRARFSKVVPMPRRRS